MESNCGHSAIDMTPNPFIFEQLSDDSLGESGGDI
jgi:hypothetical protein